MSDKEVTLQTDSRCLTCVCTYHSCLFVIFSICRTDRRRRLLEVMVPASFYLNDVHHDKCRLLLCINYNVPRETTAVMQEGKANFMTSELGDNSK